MKKKQAAEDTLYLILQAHGLGSCVRQYQFAHPLRKWRFDFAWPDIMVALEYEGGAFQRDGHRTTGNFLKDIEKYNAAALMGWTVLRVCAWHMGRAGGADLNTLLGAIEARLDG